MMRRCLACGGVWLILCALSAAQESGEAAADGLRKPTALGVRQQRVERMMEDLERKFKTLSEALQKEEPERAERLIKTLQAAKEKLIHERMEQITLLLNEARLESATTEQQEILADLRALIALLLEEDHQGALDEYAQLEEWKEQIERIIADQHEQFRESDKIANKDTTLADLEAKIEAVKALIKKQEQVNRDTKERLSQGIQAIGRAADAQHEVRKETEKLAGEIAAAGARQESSQETSQGENPADSPSEKPGDSPGGNSEKPGGQGDGGSSAESPGGQGGEAGGGQSSASQQSNEPGHQSLRRAAEHQKSAEQGLQQGKGKSAVADQQRALADLKKALDELERERRRIASLPPETFDELSKKQFETSQETDDLAKKMQESSSGGGQGGEGGQGGSSGGGKKTPGQNQVQQAQKSMQQAGGDLKKQDPGGAGRHQEEAIKQLEKALQEIEERLAQLREETQLEKLARLEARFQEMLARQRVVTLGTAEYDSKANAKTLKRTDRLLLAKYRAEERELAELAYQAYEIIVEDGTSVVFPQVVRDLQEDLTTVAELLETPRTDGYTQLLQREIETTLEELIEALKKIQKDKQPSQQGGGGGGGEPPLLPNSAELKLLRASQMRVNRRTKAFDEIRPEGALEDELLKKEIAGIASRQQEIAIMTELMIERSRQYEQ